MAFLLLPSYRVPILFPFDELMHFSFLLPTSYQQELVRDEKVANQR